jgi:hypothetical protein
MMSSYADAAGIPIANADSSNCTGSNIVYGPSGCSGCCSGYDGAGREAIQYIQNLLVTLGYLEVASVTGQYGEKTYAAVQAFQKAYGLSLDGRVGSSTLPLLKNQADARRTASTLHSETGTALVPTTPVTPTGLVKKDWTKEPWFWPAIGLGSIALIGGAIWWRSSK